MKTSTLTAVAIGLVLGAAGCAAGLVLSLLASPSLNKPAPEMISKHLTFGQAEAHFDFSTAERLAVPCFPGYRCSEIDGRKLPDGRFSWGVIFIEPEARQSVRPSIRRPDNE